MESREEDVSDADVAGAIRAEMARRTRSQRELGQAIGMSGPTVSSRMNGSTSFTIAELARVASFLKMSVEDLLESAIFGSRVMNPNSVYKERSRVEMVVGESDPDPWRQPPGSLKKRRSSS